MKKIDFNYPLKDLKGDAIPGDNVGQCLASVLWLATEGNKMKFTNWAIKLYANETFEIDKADYDLLKGFITNNKNLYAFSETQMLDLLGDWKD
jgi:hypothetical protein